MTLAIPVIHLSQTYPSIRNGVVCNGCIVGVIPPVNGILGGALDGVAVEGKTPPGSSIIFIKSRAAVAKVVVLDYHRKDGVAFASSCVA